MEKDVKAAELSTKNAELLQANNNPVHAQELLQSILDNMSASRGKT
jgi:hypothetical protein